MPADGAVESALVFAGSQASAYLIGAVSAGIIVLVLVLWVFSALGSYIGYGGFKARRRNNRIEVEYGLLQHTFQGIDIDRVQSVVGEAELHPPSARLLRAVSRQD